MPFSFLLFTFLLGFHQTCRCSTVVATDTDYYCTTSNFPLLDGIVHQRLSSQTFDKRAFIEFENLVIQWLVKCQYAKLAEQYGAEHLRRDGPSGALSIEIYNVANEFVLNRTATVRALSTLTPPWLEWLWRWVKGWWQTTTVARDPPTPLPIHREKSGAGPQAGPLGEGAGGCPTPSRDFRLKVILKRTLVIFDFLLRSPQSVRLLRLGLIH